jgi:hypothetical protein
MASCALARASRPGAAARRPDVTDAALDAFPASVGPFKPIRAARADRARWIDEMLRPEMFAGLAAPFAPKLTPHRDSGWTSGRDHVADSHMVHIRTRFALTEDVYTVMPYKEALWATLADAQQLDVEPSLAVLRGLHQRWVTLLRSLSSDQFEIRFTHPESGPMTLDKLVQLYEWHGRHHAAHINGLKTREGWA